MQDTYIFKYAFILMYLALSMETNKNEDKL